MTYRPGRSAAFPILMTILALIATSGASAQRLALEAVDNNEPRYEVQNETHWASYAPVETLGYSSDSENFYFWMDGPSASNATSVCPNGSKFGLPATTENEELIAMIKMAFLSGKTVRVQWRFLDCTGSAPRPHYLKLAR